MKAQTLGIITSFAFHSLVGITIYAMDRITASSPKPFALDFSITYDYVPKGNSLDKSLLTQERKKIKKIKKEKIISSKRVLGRKENNEEKKFGVKNGDEGADTIYIKENLNKIQARIKNKIIYPAIARRMGWAGKVYIAFLLNKEGIVSNVKVKKSSGYPILDNCAVRTIKSLSGLPKPPLLTQIDVPFSFSLSSIN